MPLMPGAQPFAHEGGPIAALLVHGFTGTPQSMRPWGEYLAENGFTVRIPRLPGHGTSWREANLTTWQDWYAEVERNFIELREKHEKVFVMGLSMGGTLALRLAERRPRELAGMVLANPSVHTEHPLRAVTSVLAKVTPVWTNISGDIKKPGGHELAYDRMPLKAAMSLQQLWPLVKQDIADIETPTLLYSSQEDHTVEPSNSAWLVANLRVADFTQVMLTESYHVVTLDNDAEKVFAGSVEFIRRLTS